MKRPKKLTLRQKKKLSQRYGPRWKERYDAKRLAREFARMQEGRRDPVAP